VLEHLAKRTDAKPVLECENEAYRDGNFYSLRTGLAHVGDEFMTMNVDHIFPRRLFDHAFAGSRGVSAVCDRDRDLLGDCMKVLATGDGPDARVSRIDKKLTEYNCGYIGSTIVRREGRNDYFAAVERVQASGDRKAWAEMVLGSMAEAARDGAGQAPHIADCSGFGWFEVDDAGDLAAAEAGLAAAPDFLR